MNASVDRLRADRPAAAPAGTLERHLEVALQIARGGIWEWQVDSGAVLMSDSYLRLLGIQDPATVGEPRAFWEAHVHPEDLDHVMSAALDHAAGRTSSSLEIEYRLKHSDGHWVHVLDRGRVIQRDAHGKATVMVGFVMDITERFETEVALRASEERLRLATNAVNGFIYEVDLASDVAIRYGVENFTGYTSQEIDALPGGWLQLVHEGDRERVGQEIARHRLDFSDYHIEYRLLRRDGTEVHVWHRGASLNVQSGNPRAYGFVEDVSARVQAEKALRASEFRFRAVAELTPGYVFEARRSADGSAAMIYASASFETVMGIPRADFDARGGWRWFCTPASLEAYWRAFDRLRAGLRSEVDLQGVNARSEDKWLRLKTMPVYDSVTGRRTGTMGAVHDITEAKRGEDFALLESQSVLRTIAEGSAAQLALFSREGRCLFMNRSLLGRPVAEMLGMRVDDIVHPEHAASARASFERIIATGEPQDFEANVRWPGGEIHNLEVRMRAVRSGGRNVGVVTNITDVTQYRHQQESLRLHAHIIETMQEGVSMKDNEGVILLTNPAFDGMFGYARGELQGRSDEILTPLSSALYIRQRNRLHSTVACSGPLTVELLEGMRKDGSRFVASCTFAAITVAGEQRFVTVLSDVTERKRLEREILQIVNREQHRIGSDLHDGLGQGLTGVALMLKSLAARLGRAADATVRADVEHIIGLVNGAIDSTRGLARGLSPVSADRDGLVMGLEGLVSQNNDRYGVHVTLHNDLPDELQFDDASANHLYRIAQEALANAVRHGKANRVSMALSAESGQIELVIQDNGTGFDASTTREAGMGLKIMRYRAQMLGGELSVESIPGSGTIIRCQCPDVEGREPA